MNKDSVLNGVLIDGLKDLSTEELGSHMRGFFRNIKIRICEHTKKSPQQRSTITTRKIQKKNCQIVDLSVSARLKEFTFLYYLL